MTRSNRPSRRCRTVVDLPFMLTLVWLLHWNASTAVSGPPGDDVFATWEELAPRVQNILLEAEGTVTFTPGADVLIDSSEPAEPITRPFRLRLLVDFPKVFLEVHTTDATVRDRVYIYEVRSQWCYDGQRLWAFHLPRGPGSLPLCTRWHSLRAFTEEGNYFFSMEGIGLMEALFVAPQYQRSEYASLWRARQAPWDHAEEGVWQGQDAYRVFTQGEESSVAWVTRQPPYACLSWERWRRSDTTGDILLERYVLHWENTDEWPRGLSRYEVFHYEGTQIAMQVTRLETGVVKAEDFPAAPPLVPGTLVRDVFEKRRSSSLDLWVSASRRIPANALPPGFLDKLEVGEARLSDLAKEDHRPWAWIVGGLLLVGAALLWGWFRRSRRLRAGGAAE